MSAPTTKFEPDATNDPIEAAKARDEHRRAVTHTLLRQRQATVTPEEMRLIEALRDAIDARAYDQGRQAARDLRDEDGDA